jgi:transposase-like protein
MSEEVKFRTFSTPFKQGVMHRLEAGEPVAGLARELGIARKLIYEWRKAWRNAGIAGLNRKRGPKPGPRRVKPPPEPAPPGSAGELAQAKTRIAELERVIGRQQVDLDFFRKALHALDAPAAMPAAKSASTRSSKS